MRSALSNDILFSSQALGWLVKMYGPEVNMGVSHRRALQLLCLRLGIADVDEHGPPIFVSYVSSAVSGAQGQTVTSETAILQAYIHFGLSCLHRCFGTCKRVCSLLQVFMLIWRLCALQVNRDRDDATDATDRRATA